MVFQKEQQSRREIEKKFSDKNQCHNTD